MSNNNQLIIGPPKKQVRIWLPDSVNEHGGIWVNCTVHDVTSTIENVIIEEGQSVDIENTLESFDGYLIEEIK
jgi:hypothetical protein